MESETRATSKSPMCSCHMHRHGFVCDVCGPFEECEFDHPDVDTELGGNDIEWAKGEGP
jgi:hypothetical protein